MDKRADTADSLSQLVADFAQRVPDVSHAAVVSADGLPLACSLGLPVDRMDRLAAVTSGMASMVRGAARFFRGGPVARIALMMEHGILIVMPVDGNALMAVFTALDGDTDNVSREMEIFCERAGRFLPRPRHQAVG